jgi:hypothetical protein
MTMAGVRVLTAFTALFLLPFLMLRWTISALGKQWAGPRPPVGSMYLSNAKRTSTQAASHRLGKVELSFSKNMTSGMHNNNLTLRKNLPIINARLPIPAYRRLYCACTMATRSGSKILCGDH